MVNYPTPEGRGLAAIEVRAVPPSGSMSASRRPRTVLFLIADTGAGHRSAANAILAAMRQLAADEVSGKQPRAHGIRHPGWRAVTVDAFAECCRFPLRQGALLYGLAVQHSPRLYGEIYRFTNSRTRFGTARRLCQPFLRQGLRQLIERTRPDVIVSIHPLLNHVTIQTLRELRLRIPLVTVVTDLITLHCAWTAPGVDACVVPTEAARELALAAGIPREGIHLLGMPIHPAFARADGRSPEEKRAALGLDPALPVILRGGGGGGGGGPAAVEAVSSEELPAQLVVIAGHNQRLRAELERVRTRFRTPVHVFGFVDNMPDFMHAADILVTKAGPSTICEAIACELPILLTGAVPGQEEGNVDFVRDNGIGELIEMPRELAGALRQLLDPANPRLAALRQAMRRMRQPQASFDIARLILAALPEPATPSTWEPRPAPIPIRHVDGMRRALPALARRRAGSAEHWVPGLANLARMRALLKRERHETVQLWRSSGGRGRDDARAPLGSGRGSTHLR